MIELTEHEAYGLLRGSFNRVDLDIAILSFEGEYQGLQTHQEAVVEAFKVLNDRFSAYGFSVDVDQAKMAATAVSAQEFLRLPPDEHHESKENRNRSFSIPNPLPYWFAFLEPPHGTPYTKEDFETFNAVLFPNPEALEVYRWNDDFSNYFDAGKEWWGTGLWTAYDAINRTMVVIGASLTD